MHRIVTRPRQRAHSPRRTTRGRRLERRVLSENTRGLKGRESVDQPRPTSCEQSVGTRSDNGQDRLSWALESKSKKFSDQTHSGPAALVLVEGRGLRTFFDGIYRHFFFYTQASLDFSKKISTVGIVRLSRLLRSDRRKCSGNMAARTAHNISVFYVFFFFWRSRYAPVSENCRRRRRWPGDVSPRAIDRQQYNNYRVRPNTYDEYSIADCRRRPAQVISSTTTTMPQSHVHIYTCRSAHTRVPFLWRVQKETRIPCIIINVCVIYTRRVPRIGHCASTVTS